MDPRNAGEGTTLWPHGARRTDEGVRPYIIFVDAGVEFHLAALRENQVPGFAVGFQAHDLGLAVGIEAEHGSRRAADTPESGHATNSNNIAERLRESQMSNRRQLNNSNTGKSKSASSRPWSRRQF